MALHNKELEKIIEDFALFYDWEERYRYLIDLGRELPTMPNNMKTDNRIVQGCTSRVWMDLKIQDGALFFSADSDAHIVRGLIAILYHAFHGKTFTEIINTDIQDAFIRMGLEQNLSPNRRNGFFAIVAKIRQSANNQQEIT